jgi:uncharacterized Zn finger protein (UPF0148 family)
MSTDDHGVMTEIPCPHCGKQTATPLDVILGGGEATCSQCHQGFTVESSVPEEKQEKLKHSPEKLTRTIKY